MIKKIVAIGGGENGRIKSDGSRLPYETFGIDSEIVRLTGKERPNFLFIGHAQILEYQQSYYETMCKIYADKFGCMCKMLKSNELDNLDKANDLLLWADIIYVGGGNTVKMIDLWIRTGFDKLLKKAWQDGKVMCGISAGANCWFEECLTDSNGDLSSTKGLGFINGYFVPHCEDGRGEKAKSLLKDKDIVGIMCSSCAALEIVDNQYCIILEDSSFKKNFPFVSKCFWNDEKYYEEIIEAGEYKMLDCLLDKDVDKKLK